MFAFKHGMNIYTWVGPAGLAQGPLHQLVKLRVGNGFGLERGADAGGGIRDVAAPVREEGAL